MRLSEGCVYLQRLHYCCPRLRHRLSWRKDTGTSKHAVAVSQPGIGEGVTRIFFNRLLEVLDSFLQAVFRSLMPEVATFEIQLISVGAHRVTLRQLLLLRGVRAPT